MTPLEQAKAALEAARKTMRNVRGAVETDQVDDKDARRQLSLGIEAIDAALASIDAALASEGWRTDMSTVPTDGSPLMIWVMDGIMQPHCLAPISVTENGEWWDDATGDQIEPINGATAWQPAPPAPETRP